MAPAASCCFWQQLGHQLDVDGTPGQAATVRTTRPFPSLRDLTAAGAPQGGAPGAPGFLSVDGHFFFLTPLPSRHLILSGHLRWSGGETGRTFWGPSQPSVEIGLTSHIASLQLACWRYWHFLPSRIANMPKRLNSLCRYHLRHEVSSMRNCLSEKELSSVFVQGNCGRVYMFGLHLLN